MQQIREVVASEFDAVNTLIIEQLHSDVDLVENIGHYIVDAGGKRLRPLLALLSAGACGGINDKHIQLAAVIEFIHTATLLHDDVVDVSALRRGRPTANDKWGSAPSVLVGDFIYSRAFQMLVSIGDMGVMGLLSDTTNTIAEGEVLQLVRAGNADGDREQYFSVIQNKTAVLFAAACCGAALLSDQRNYADTLYEYGMNLGMAFQLIDDVLDYEGNPEETGKNIGDDLNEGKATLPLIYAMENGSQSESDLIRQAITEKSAANLNQVVEIVRSTGALDYTRNVAREYSGDALTALVPLKASKYHQALLDLSKLALSRSK
ncbi:octaprenyl-diphosphate synthase [Litorivivens lipolytica]|uniref:Octaprenyl diphosphate synthase n=1 Tax=Litorivivens lipolytica TaxID=1524264 RepID=A0A7W4W4U7_9GAMM|nr:polyprenyl synthetase family protein [Litorivivens lipolytica]MBB3047483.1 octaprenyl-diphosphate synthase [Litorivivens lipolytica]